MQTLWKFDRLSVSRHQVRHDKKTYTGLILAQLGRFQARYSLNYMVLTVGNNQVDVRFRALHSRP